MSDADFLRETARGIRRDAERARGLVSARWVSGERCVWAGDDGDPVVSDGDAGDGGCHVAYAADFIAAWDPFVAFAVADWIMFALAVPHHGLCAADSDVCPCIRGLQIQQALAVARTYRRQS